MNIKKRTVLNSSRAFKHFAITTALAFLAGAAYCQQAPAPPKAAAGGIHDVRDVYGKTVDLGPVHEWFGKPANQRGPRPMPHWHQFHIIDIPIPLNSSDLCVMSGEDGHPLKVYLYHLDYSLRTPFVTVYYMNQRILDLQKQIREDQGVVDRMRNNNTPMGRGERDAAINRVNEGKRELGDCIQKRAVAQGQIPKAKAIPFLAMNSGTTLSDPATGEKREVWECGVRK